MTWCLCSLAMLVISLWIDGVSTILIMVRMYIRWSSDGTMAHGALSDGG